MAHGIFGEGLFSKVAEGLVETRHVLAGYLAE